MKDNNYKERFERNKAWITSDKKRTAAFTFIYKWLPAVVFAAYPTLLLYLFVTHDGRLLLCIAVPLFMFATLSMARYLMNFPRPYEVFDITPVISKDTRGKSFPSRHTASAVVIALTILYISPPIGAVFIVIAVLIALSRIAGGVHFPRDVICAVVYALICASVYIFIK